MDEQNNLNNDKKLEEFENQVSEISENRLTKKERRELKHREKEEQKGGALKSAKNKKIMKWSFIAIIILIIAWLAVSFVKDSEKTETKENIISRNGIHTHSELMIYIKGEKQKIPLDIGIGITHNPLHTHDESGVIHLEFSGVVKEGDTKLGNFFKVWEKRFDANCILEYCNGSEGTVKMLVNSVESRDFEKYFMKDGDKIEIRYE